MVSRLVAIIAAAVLSIATGQTLRAQDFPTRPVRMVIAFPPGGPTDFVGRVIAEKMKDILGQPVVIENKAGANGAIGADFVAKADADGHTIFLTTVGAVCITPNMRTDLPYDTLRDFAPISLVVRNTTVLVVKPNSLAKDAKEFAAIAKSKPGTIPFASTGVGSMPHLALELYQAAAGIKFVHVPYRGAAPALTDLIGEQVQAVFLDLPVLMAQIQGGKVKPLGQATATRNAKLPNVPTLIEQGYANTVADNWYALLAPAKTPPAVVAKLNAALAGAINDPTVRDKLVQSGAVPANGTPAELAAVLKDELARWGKVVKENNIKEPAGG